MALMYLPQNTPQRLDLCKMSIRSIWKLYALLYFYYCSPAPCVRPKMWDVIYLGIGLTFLGLAILYLHATDRL